MPTQKPLVDALVDAGIVPDDTPEHVPWSQPQIHPVHPGKPGRIWLEVQSR